MFKRIPVLALAALLASCSSEPTGLRASDRSNASVSALTASIYGPSPVQPSATCLYEAQVSGGTPPYSYAWVSSTGDYSYTGQLWATAPDAHLDGAGFVLELYVTDSAGQGVEVTRSIGVVRATGATCYPW
jgi:hypothetical protein